jgi:uncharacterized membrane protein YcjF (UPF0283 family)
MEKVILTLVSTLAVIITIDTMRKCYQQKEWLFFALEAVVLIVVVAMICIK